MKNVMEEINRIQNSELINSTDFSLAYTFTRKGEVWRVDITDCTDDLLASVWPILDTEDERVSFYPGEIKKGESCDIFSPDVILIIADILRTFAKESYTL